MNEAHHSRGGTAKRFPWRLVLGGLASMACLAILFSRAGVVSWESVAHLNPWAASLAFLMGLLLLLVRAFRWQVLFPPLSRPAFRACCGVLAASNFLNTFVPARGGDVLRCLLISRQQPSGGLELAAATLVLEKVFDGLTLVAVLLFAVFHQGHPAWVSAAAAAGGAVFGGVLVCVLLLKAWSAPLSASAERAPEQKRLFGPATTALRRFVAGLETLDSGRRLLAIGGITLFLWLADAATTWLLAGAMDVSLSFVAAAVVSAVIGLGFMIPSGPANVGTYEAAAVAGLSLFGVGLEQALPAALVLHACALLLSLAQGLIAILVLNRSPRPASGPPPVPVG